LGRSRIEAIRRGDARAFEALIHELAPRVHAYACSLAPRRVDAEDLAQEAFLGLLRNIDSVAHDEALAYLLRSVRNRWIDRHRAFAARGRPLEDAPEAISGEPGPSDLPERAERDDLVHRAIEALPESQGEVVRLRVFARLDFASIAEEVAVPLATVRSRYRAALEKLKLTLGRTIGDV